MFDTYHWRTSESWIKDFEKDFPKMFHFFKYNKAALEARRQAVFGDYRPNSNQNTQPNE